MSDVSNHLFETIDAQNSHESAATRRQLIKGTTAALAGAGVLGLAMGNTPASAKVATNAGNAPETILAVAATAEVLATIVNTLGPELLGNKLDKTTALNIRAAAQQEKNHYEVLTGALGAKPVTTSIHVPDEIFASKENLLKTLVVGDQVFVNAYLIGLTVFARQGTLAGSKAARYAGEIMAVESVHRALALQSLGLLGNDRAYAKFGQKEDVAGLPTTNQGGFYKILDAVAVLESAGFGFGKAGSKPGKMYTYEDVSKRTPTEPDVNTLTVS
jgi:hypothetical protein